MDKESKRSSAIVFAARTDLMKDLRVLMMSVGSRPRVVEDDTCEEFRSQPITKDEFIKVFSPRSCDMDNETKINPWITVSKKKRNRTPVQNESFQHHLVKPETEILQANNFTGLSLQDESSDDVDSTAVETNRFPPSSPGIQSPPRKKSKKDPNRVCLALQLIQKSHYPVIRVHSDAVNKQVGLTVIPMMTFNIRISET
jgi:hypothetical protein